MGTSGKSAEEFFGTLERNGVKLVVDIRLYNTSQLAGFTKMNDLRYFLRRLSHIAYRHETILSPSEELLENYRHKRI